MSLCEAFNGGDDHGRAQGPRHGKLAGEEGKGGGEGAGVPGGCHDWGRHGGTPGGSARPGLLVRSPWFGLNAAVREKKGNMKEEEEKRRERKERKKGREKRKNKKGKIF
jgi:hypothetical protein